MGKCVINKIPIVVKTAVILLRLLVIPNIKNGRKNIGKTFKDMPIVKNKTATTILLSRISLIDNNMNKIAKISILVQTQVKKMMIGFHHHRIYPYILCFCLISLQNI